MRQLRTIWKIDTEATGRHPAVLFFSIVVPLVFIICHFLHRREDIAGIFVGETTKSIVGRCDFCHCCRARLCCPKVCRMDTLSYSEVRSQDPLKRYSPCNGMPNASFHVGMPLEPFHSIYTSRCSLHPLDWFLSCERSFNFVVLQLLRCSGSGASSHDISGSVKLTFQMFNTVVIANSVSILFYLLKCKVRLYEVTKWETRLTFIICSFSFVRSLRSLWLLAVCHDQIVRSCVLSLSASVLLHVVEHKCFCSFQQ